MLTVSAVYNGWSFFLFFILENGMLINTYVVPMVI